MRVIEHGLQTEGGRPVLIGTSMVIGGGRGIETGRGSRLEGHDYNLKNCEY